MTTARFRPQTLAIAALVGGNVALAIGPWFVRLADVGPVSSAFWRLAIAAPLLLAVIVARGELPRRLPAAIWWVVLIGGAFFAADLAAWHAGILRTKFANATLFGNSASLLFPIWGFVVARVWPNRWQLAALLLATAGAALLMGRSFELSPRFFAGDLLCFSAGVFYTFYLVLMIRAREAMSSLSALLLATVAGVPMIGVAAWLLGETFVPHLWWPLVALAIGSQVIGQGLMIYALVALPPMLVGIAFLLQPVIGGLIGWTIYGERLSAADAAGAVLIALALVLVRREPRAVAPKAAEVQ